MKLHLDQELFKGLILQVEQTHKLPADILEKDYYVTLILQELAAKQNQIKAYFKGGTALYKAIGHINRFSEDIDLTVDVNGLSNNQARLRLKAATCDYSLSLDKQDEHYLDRKGTITAVYDYDSVFFQFAVEQLHRVGKILVEATSFTVSEPIANYTIAPLIYSLTNKENKLILKDQYNVKPFEIHTITLERIFIDKVFAAEYYFIRQKWFDVAKHIYDLVILLSIDNIKSLLVDQNKLKYLIALKRKEEAARKGGIPAEQTITNFTYFSGLLNNQDFNTAYHNMQKKYVLSNDDVIGITKTILSINYLHDKLQNIC